MKIDSYAFGAITINGQTYHQDLIVLPDRILPNWRRTRGHSLDIEDIPEIIACEPDILIVGTGTYGAIDIPPKTRTEITGRNISLLAAPTERACAFFNEHMDKGANAAGAFHLTC